MLVHSFSTGRLCYHSVKCFSRFFFSIFVKKSLISSKVCEKNIYTNLKEPFKPFERNLNENMIKLVFAESVPNEVIVILVLNVIFVGTNKTETMVSPENMTETWNYTRCPFFYEYIINIMIFCVYLSVSEIICRIFSKKKNARKIT